jgi:prepilin-type N-terminal cleavage/methylation domain-containing protein
MMATGSSNSEDGFTLIETLVGLLILAISSGLLIQSIASASAQLRSARNLIAAEQTALLVLAEHSVDLNPEDIKEGIDSETEMFWRYSERATQRNAGTSVLADIKLIEIEVRPAINRPAIYRLKTLSQKKKLP